MSDQPQTSAVYGPLANRCTLREAQRPVSIAGSIFNMFDNAAGIVKPIVIAYLAAGSGSFNGAPSVHPDERSPPWSVIW
ncbi:hypothetical protein [Burkholderia multivorans]|uniref:hypothetical protein n=1 Tax=Burkholderia multivorans TaxID=87883 RepID=UPI001C257729|nr:hypothetical protein [Burkholderia multivorans]